MILIIITAAFINLVESNDLNLGRVLPKSTELLNEKRQVEARAWIRTDTIRIDAPAGEAISAVFVEDLRSDKKGIAYIESGGIGQDFVTIGLRSAGEKRGFRFKLKVYSDIVIPAKILPFYRPPSTTLTTRVMFENDIY